MTLHSLVSKLSKYLPGQYLSRLYYREWTGLELLTIALAATILLLLIIRLQRKARARRMRANQTEENSPIIGRKLVDSKGTQQGIQDSEKHRLAFIAEKAGKQKRWKQTTKKWKKLKEQIEQLRHEITKYKQAEARLKNQLANLTSANEALQREIAEYNQAKEQTEQRVTGLEAADESLQPEITESGQTEQKQEENAEKTKQPRRLSKHVDAEQLKAIAEFAKQLRGRYRHISEQSSGPAISGKGDSA